MLKTIAIVTLVVQNLAAVEPAYEVHLKYETVARGAVTRQLASDVWDAPAMKGRRYVLMQPESGEPVYLRFIEAPPGLEPVRPFMTHGWNATEMLVTDPDATARSLEASPFRVIGPPIDLGPGDNAPRALQALGPADEVLYLTRIIPAGTEFDLGSARTAVDRVFITVVGGPSIEALRDFYGKALGLPLGDTSSWKIGVLARAHAMPEESRFPLAVAVLPKRFLIELDGYPPTATARARSRGALPGGMAMVSFTAERLAELGVPWRQRPRKVSSFPYDGRRVAVTVGPAGEWIEVIETQPPP